MSEPITFNYNGDIMLLTLSNFNGTTDDTRVFISSKNINIFPCSRRGQITFEGDKLNCDPEARLNTERTNRLRTAINGFTDSFIDSFTVDKDKDGNELETGSLVFVLKGYRVEIKNFKPSDIAQKLRGDSDSSTVDTDTIYAHLSLRDDISLGVKNYFTEILYRQTGKSVDHNYIDVEYSDSEFFMGVSFTNKPANDYIGGNMLRSADLPLFAKNSDGAWELVQTSKLPKIEHGDAEDSIKIGPTTITGDFTVKQISGEGKEEISFEITKHGVGTVNVPLHITKATTVDGMTNLSAASIYGLIVGEKVEGDIYENGTIKAKEHIETPTLEATESIKTPTLDIKSIENRVDTTGVNINDNLNIATGHAAVADIVNVNTINSRLENGTITVESPVTLNGNATLSKNLTVGTEGDLDTGKITTKNLIQTPTLNVNSITSDSDKVEINKPINVTGKTTINNDLEVTGTTGTPTLKVDTANSEITVDSSLKVTGKAILTDELEVTKKATLINGLQVTNSDTDLQKLMATELAVATDVLIVTKDDAKFTKPVIVDSSLTANNVQIKDQGQVPALELYHFKNGPYQLQFKFNTAPTIIEEK